jgi:4-hydroxybenzoate polyprenyltransferase
LGELQVPICLGLAVVFWLAGFDIIYSLQDREFDHRIGLYSIPVRFGVSLALQLSSFFHLCTVLFLALVGMAAQAGFFYWLGFSAVSAVLLWEHRIVTPGDLSRINRAFFDYNAYVSIGYFLFTLADVLISSHT